MDNIIAHYNPIFIHMPFFETAGFAFEWGGWFREDVVKRGKVEVKE